MQNHWILVATALVVERVRGDRRAIRLGGTVQKVVGERDIVGITVVEPVNREKNVSARRHQITPANHVILGVGAGQRPGDGSRLGRDGELNALKHARIACRERQLADKRGRTWVLSSDCDGGVIRLSRKRASGEKKQSDDGD